MPRGSTATKRQQGAANQRDTRHENGLVGPGKPVRKQKSHGHLSGHAKSGDIPTSPPILPDVSVTNGHAKQISSAGNISESRMPLESLRRMSVGCYSESSSSESYGLPLTMPLTQDNHRQIDVNASKNPAVHRDAVNFRFAVTVLRSMPLADTIAILILLLQLPPTILSIIHSLFILLTIVLPTFSTGDFSLSSRAEGTTATPSFYVVILVWLLLLGVYSWISTPQAWLSLEFAQAIMALALGGVSSGREAGMNKILYCVGIVGANQFVKRSSKRSTLPTALSSLTNGHLGSTDMSDSLEPASKADHEGRPGYIHLWLALYIIAQGLTKYVRDWYMRTYKSNPEAPKEMADAGSDAHISNTPDAELSTSLPFTNNATTIKKRRKQSAQLRTQQPVWSALASTKITMVKEYETSSAAAEFAGTNAVDASNLGNAPFHEQADCIWITHVGHDSVVFATSYFPTHTVPQHSEESIGSAAIDTSKPFYIRVNSSVWQPARIYTGRADDQPLDGYTCWEGEIPGLIANSGYLFEFVSTTDESVTFSTRITTLSPKADVFAGPVLTPVVGTRPGSPKETLKNSIVAGEKRLAEERSKIKRERKDHRSRLNTVRKDIDKLNSSIASSGGSDDKLRQKIQQSKTHMKQAEEDLDSITAEIEILSATPIVDPLQYRALRSGYRSEREEHKQLESDFKNATQATENDLQSLRAEIASLQQKQEKMQARILKLNGDLARMTDANARGLNEAQRIANDREARNMERAGMESLLKQRLDEIELQIAIVAPELKALAGEVHYLAQFEAQAEYMTKATSTIPSSPSASTSNLTYGTTASNSILTYGSIPEGNVAPGTSNYPWWNPVPTTSGLYSPAPYSAGMMNASASAQSPYRRGRSSSMLSNISGFTQSSTGEPSTYPSHTADEAERKDSSGSASVSGSGSAGSVGDPRSPDGNRKIGPKWGSDIWGGK
ncbi:hypothetical protein BJ878DRAFT_521655 [Calycina marina]|uniref:Ubiquitination network signaling protein n=1 Tax=Calycina marina TaxID=1763456 RepID=A0A9P7YWS6_9HELO|nr:hypothetical protein BJ878DRAFT_521655 [Calycina marina]